MKRFSLLKRFKVISQFLFFLCFSILCVVPVEGNNASLHCEIDTIICSPLQLLIDSNFMAPLKDELTTWKQLDDPAINWGVFTTNGMNIITENSGNYKIFTKRGTSYFYSKVVNKRLNHNKYIDHDESLRKPCLSINTKRISRNKKVVV